MKKNTTSGLKVVDVPEKVNEQVEAAKENYLGFMEQNKNFLNELMKAMDMQLEFWLCMQLGYLDFMKNIFDIKPTVKPFEHHLNPFGEHIETFGEFNKEFFEIKKRKTEKLARTLQKYHRKAVENTITAFDKYCEMLSTA
ncbi:MAG: hypothetical protein ACHQ6U_10360 [Thermodesulfobacteriota bacterium]